MTQLTNFMNVVANIRKSCREDQVRHIEFDSVTFEELKRELGKTAAIPVKKLVTLVGYRVKENRNLAPNTIKVIAKRLNFYVETK